MHSLSLYFISAACFSAFIAVPIDTENFRFFLTLVSTHVECINVQERSEGIVVGLIGWYIIKNIYGKCLESY